METQFLAAIDAEGNWISALDGEKIKQLEAAENQVAAADPVVEPLAAPIVSTFYLSDALQKSSYGKISNYKVDELIDITTADQRAAAGEGITFNDKAISFAIEGLEEGRTSRTSLDLETLNGSLSNSDFKQDNSNFAAFSISDTGEFTTFTYDPVQNLGSKLYITKRKSPEGIESENVLVVSTFEDGGYGDRDGTANGVIQDPSAIATVELSPSLTLVDQNTLLVSDETNDTPAAIRLNIKLTERTDAVNNLYYVAFNPDEDVELSISELKDRSLKLLSSLESSDVTLPETFSAQSNLAMINGQSLRFFAIQDALLSDLDSLDDARFDWLDLTEPTTTAESIELSSDQGLKLNITQTTSYGDLSDLITGEQLTAPLLDFRDVSPNDEIQATLELSREAYLNSSISFYEVLDTQGTILDPITNTLLRPSDAGYSKAALDASDMIAPLSNLTVADDDTSSTLVTFASQALLAPVARVGENTYFAFAEASSDGHSHFASMGSGIIGLEDLVGLGDRDFDDMLIQLKQPTLVAI